MATLRMSKNPELLFTSKLFLLLSINLELLQENKITNDLKEIKTDFWNI